MNELQTKTFNLPQVYNESNYLEAGERLAKAGQVLQWELGRWFDSLAWGDKKSVCEQVGVSYPNAKNCGLVFRKFQKSFRSDNLSFKHHKILAIDALNDDQRTELLKQAEKEEMSSKQLTTARDIFLGRDTVKLGIDLPDTDISTTQASDSPTLTNEDNMPSMADNSVYEVRSDPPTTYGDTQQPEQSYNATFEANKELTDLKQVNIDLVIKYDTEHRRTVTLEGDIRSLKSEITKLEEAAIIDDNIITQLNEQIEKLKSRKSVTKAPTHYNEGTVIEVLARFIPDGVRNTADMRSALSDGYRKAKGISEKLKANNAQGLNEYLKALSADDINQLIKIKKDEIRDKAKAKRLSKAVKK